MAAPAREEPRAKDAWETIIKSWSDVAPPAAEPAAPPAAPPAADADVDADADADVDADADKTLESRLQDAETKKVAAWETFSGLQQLAKEQGKTHPEYLQGHDPETIGQWYGVADTYYGAKKKFHELEIAQGEATGDPVLAREGRTWLQSNQQLWDRSKAEHEALQGPPAPGPEPAVEAAEAPPAIAAPATPPMAEADVSEWFTDTILRYAGYQPDAPEAGALDDRPVPWHGPTAEALRGSPSEEKPHQVSESEVGTMYPHEFFPEGEKEERYSGTLLGEMRQQLSVKTAVEQKQLYDTLRGHFKKAEAAVIPAATAFSNARLRMEEYEEKATGREREEEWRALAPKPELNTNLQKSYDDFFEADRWADTAREAYRDAVQVLTDMSIDPGFSWEGLVETPAEADRRIIPVPNESYRLLQQVPRPANYREINAIREASGAHPRDYRPPDFFETLRSRLELIDDATLAELHNILGLFEDKELDRAQKFANEAAGIKEDEISALGVDVAMLAPRELGRSARRHSYGMALLSRKEFAARADAARLLQLKQAIEQFRIQRMIQEQSGGQSAD